MSCLFQIDIGIYHGKIVMILVSLLSTSDVTRMHQIFRYLVYFSGALGGEGKEDESFVVASPVAAFDWSSFDMYVSAECVYPPEDCIKWPNSLVHLFAEHFYTLRERTISTV